MFAARPLFVFPTYFSLTFLSVLVPTQGAEPAVQVQKAVMLAPMPTQKAVEVAGLQLKLGSLQQARETLATVLRKEPSSFLALRMMAMVELHAKRPTEAIAFAQKALAMSSDDAETRGIYGAALQQAGQPEESKKLLATLSADERQRWTNELPQNPGDPVVEEKNTTAPALDRKLSVFYAAMDAKDHAKAGSILKSAEENWAHTPDYLAARAHYWQETGQPAKAASLLETLRSKHPAENGPFPHLLDLAAAYESSHQLDKARQLYGEIAASPAQLPEQRQAASQALYELRHDQMLEDGDKALATGDVSRASSLSSELVTMAPQDTTVRTFQANVLKAQGRHTEAANIYSALKAHVQPGKRFDTQLDYAGSLASSRRYDEALRAYEEIVANPQVYSAEERKEAEAELTDLRQNNLPASLLEGTYSSMDEGRLYRLTGQVSSMRLRNGMRLHLRSGTDQIHLDDKVYPESMATDRWFAVAGVEKALTENWSTSFFGGSYNDGGMAHALAEYNTASGFSGAVRLAWNDPARDTFLLEALNGRQHSISVNTITPLGTHWAWDTTLTARKLEIDGTDIGSAFDAETQLRWHPFGVDQDVYIGYALDLSDYSPQKDAFSAMEARYFSKTNALFLPSAYDAVPDSVHRHALQVHGSTRLTDSLTAGATVEVAYREESGQVEYAAMGELLWHASELLDINARAEYYTSGAGPNLGNDVVIGTLGLKVAW